MKQREKPEIWATRTPTVVFMVPAVQAEAYAAAMRRLTGIVEDDLKWEPGTIELIGLVAATAEHGCEGVYFLEEMGVDTRRITLLMLWGETAAAVNFEEVVSEECGVGAVILPETGVVLRTVRMPPLGGDWWSDPLHQAYAVVTYTRLVENGKAERDESDPYVIVSSPYAWN